MPELCTHCATLIARGGSHIFTTWWINPVLHVVNSLHKQQMLTKNELSTRVTSLQCLKVVRNADLASPPIILNNKTLVWLLKQVEPSTCHAGSRKCLLTNSGDHCVTLYD